MSYVKNLFSFKPYFLLIPFAFNFNPTLLAQENGFEATTEVVLGPSGQSIDRYLSNASALGFSGSVLVYNSGEVILHKAYGLADLGTLRKNQIHDYFYLASIAKQFGAAAIMRLEQDGKLSVTDPISKYLPVPRSKSVITIHQLLTHTSGLMTAGWDAELGDWKRLDYQETLEEIFSADLQFEPGTDFSYNNANYIILEAIVQAVSGLSYKSFLKTLFKQSGMRNTKFVGWELDRINVDSIAFGQTDQNQTNFLDRPTSWLRVGSLATTTKDMFLWIKALKGDELIDETQKSKMFKIQHKLDEGFGYGYGWVVRMSADRQRRIIFHSGDFNGYHTEVRWYPETDRIIIVLSNSEFMGNSITEKISNGIISASREESTNIPAVSLRSIEHKHNGKHYLDSQNYYKVESIANSLKVRPYGQKAINRMHSEDDEAFMNLNTKAGDWINALQKSDSTLGKALLIDENRPYFDEFLKEWNSLNKDRSSIELVGTVGGKEGQLTSILLNEQGTKFYTIIWQNGKVSATIPRDIPRVQSWLFAKSKKSGEFINYNWNTGDLTKLGFLRRGKDQFQLEFSKL